MDMRENTAAVFGIGKVGGPLAAALIRAGYNVIGVDVDPEKIKMINEGVPILPNEPEVDQTFARALKNGSARFTVDGKGASSDSRFKIITVPVFLMDKIPDFSALKSAVGAISSGIKEGDLVVLESSVPPGTTRRQVIAAIEKSLKMKVEKDFYVSYSPERIYEGRAIKDIEENYPKIISGSGERSLKVVSEFYGKIAKKGVVKMSSIEAAEMEKLAEGIYRDVNIALANELALLCGKMKIDFWEVRNAANSQPYCNIHKPGAGVGGNCIPVYPYFLIYSAGTVGSQLRLTEVSRKMNERMPTVVVSEFIELFITSKKSLKTASILGLAFRGDVDDDRLSPTYEIVKRLKSLQVNVKVHDPFVKSTGANIYLTDNINEALAGADGVIIVTDHSLYKNLDYEKISKMTGNSPIVFDARGVLYGKPNIYVLGSMS
ncbi:MAG: nucleotide sugar dehydrogenase [Nitrososphaerota archaeon]|jgi:nucleotide sugar dehydrogenase|nr:nucleotide sugar dehydrogenase [Nitrososphaerota archaeon]MDG6936476.1 nucleotide sugar dehydrogenase [Nitrososphaerota archaeon]MDG6944658.1 nucleotide sugar dehydrogenase [Nitrososphaerota archaeon]